MPKTANPDWHPLLAGPMFEHHWEGQDLADATKLSRRMAYDILLMTKRIMPVTAVRIERALGVSAVDLLTWQMRRDLEAAVSEVNAEDGPVRRRTIAVARA